MKATPYLVIGVLLIGAIVSIFITKNNPPNLDINRQPTVPQTQSVSPTMPPIDILGEETQQIPEVSTAKITTNKGEITIELFPEAAPNTVANFASKSTSGYYNNLIFHRVEDWVVQGGDPSGNGTGGGQIPTELNNNPFIRGSVGVARGNNIQISNDSQFFITKTDAPHLDKLYTNFGQVSSGLDVVDSLEIGDKIISITVE